MNYTIMVLAAYAVIMIAATVLMTNKEKSVERFCVGNRNTGWFISALSIAATWIWAPALFTSTENAYTKGFAGLFWFLVPNVLCLIFFVPFARRIRKEMPEGKVPVVIVEHKDKAGNIYGTVTHNRARGTHLLEPMKAIVKELMGEGKSVEEIGKQLGMRPEEIFRLSDFSKEDFLNMMIKPNQGYSKAEFITKI